MDNIELFRLVHGPSKPKPKAKWRDKKKYAVVRATSPKPTPSKER